MKIYLGLIFSLLVSHAQGAEWCRVSDGASDKVPIMSYFANSDSEAKKMSKYMVMDPPLVQSLEYTTWWSKRLWSTLSEGKANFDMRSFIPHLVTAEIPHQTSQLRNPQSGVFCRFLEDKDYSNRSDDLKARRIVDQGPQYLNNDFSDKKAFSHLPIHVGPSTRYGVNMEPSGTTSKLTDGRHYHIIDFSFPDLNAKGIVLSCVKTIENMNFLDDSKGFTEFTFGDLPEDIKKNMTVSCPETGEAEVISGQ